MWNKEDMEDMPADNYTKMNKERKVRRERTKDMKEALLGLAVKVIHTNMQR